MASKLAMADRFDNGRHVVGRPPALIQGGARTDLKRAGEWRLRYREFGKVPTADRGRPLCAPTNIVGWPGFLYPVARRVMVTYTPTGQSERLVTQSDQKGKC